MDTCKYKQTPHKKQSNLDPSSCEVTLITTYTPCHLCSNIHSLISNLLQIFKMEEKTRNPVLGSYQPSRGITSSSPHPLTPLPTDLPHIAGCWICTFVYLFIHGQVLSTELPLGINKVFWLTAPAGVCTPSTSPSAPHRGRPTSWDSLQLIFKVVIGCSHFWVSFSPHAGCLLSLHRSFIPF